MKKAEGDRSLEITSLTKMGHALSAQFEKANAFFEKLGRAKIPVLILVCVLLGSFAIDGLNAYLQQIVILCLINIILASSLNVINGITGQFSLGHAGFMAVGAYFSAWLSTQFAPFAGTLAPLNFPIYAVAAGCVAAIVGWGVGLPSLRLKGDYLAIVTLGFGEIIRVVLLNLGAVGGARGMYGIAVITNSWLSAAHILFWTLVTLAIFARLLDSKVGRSFLAVREDEIAAESLGLDTTAVKVQSFVLSSFFAGLAGSLFAHFTGNLNPGIFQFIKSVDVVIMVVLGGMGSLMGSVVGAVIVTTLPELLRPLKDLLGFDIRMILYALMLILLMILRPRGILGKYASKSAS
jgi:branched-chain amino acid transport system permease protein